jgi:hypothetical protein
MFIGYKILENIIPQHDQDTIEAYVNTPSLKWQYTHNITGLFGNTIDTRVFPANVLTEERIDSNILKIINTIQHNVCDILDVSFLKTYRCKINHTQPLDFDYNPNDLIHIDMKINHLVAVYYINDSDGDTVILNNSNGDSMDEMFKHINGVQNHFFTPMVSVKPKKGSVVIFNGNLYHYGDYPKINSRYVINLDFAIKNKLATKLI